jgi:hypothetical protein
MDLIDGLSKVMADLSVKEIELDTLKNKLRSKDERIVELEEIVKNKEILLAQTQAGKEEAQKEVDQMKVKITRRPILRGDKHLIWDNIATIVFQNWAHFVLV